MARLFTSASSEKITIGSDTTISTTTTNMSFGGWVKGTTWVNGATIINNGYGGGSGRGYMLQQRVSSGSNYFKIDLSFVASVSSTTALSTGTWYHVIITRGASTWNIYVNGTSENTATNNPFSISGEAETIIGCRKRDDGTYDSFFNGDLAEMAFWNRELSASEVLSMSKGFSPLFFSKSLLFYKPLIDPATTAKDYINSTAWTVTGTAKSDHPKIIYPYGDPTGVIRYDR